MPKCVVLAPLILVVLAAGCGKSSSKKLAQLSEEFVYASLAASPSAATSAGLHLYQGVKLDEILDDLSPAALDKQRRFYEKYRDQLAALKTAPSNPAVSYTH